MTVRNQSEIIEDVVKRATDGTDAVWLSFDVDVMEPAYCPGTGEPEPGGLVSRKAIAMVRDVLRQAALQALDDGESSENEAI